MTIVFSGISFAFAQEYVTVKPAFLQDRSDVCSKLHDKFSSGDANHNYRDYIKNNFVVGMIPTDTSTTTIDYNGTKLVTSINISNLTGFQNNITSPYPGVYDYPLHKLSSINYTVGERYFFVPAISNIGNKTVNIAQFPNVPLTYVIEYKNGALMDNPYPFTLTAAGSMETDDFTGTIKLEPGKSIVGNNEIFYANTNANFASSISPGLYTLTAVGGILGDVNGTCTVELLLSQPVDLTVLPEEKVPEFPFAIPVMLVGIMSILVFCRVKPSFRI